MRKRFTKFAQVAGIMLALIFTFSCSSDGNGDDSGGSFNENSQIYYEDGTTPYKDNGTIKVSSYTNDNELVYLDAGRVTNGVVKLELPNIPNEYLSSFFSEDRISRCSDYPQNIKSFGNDDGFVLTNSNGDFIGYLNIAYRDEHIVEVISYYYFSEAGKITCDYVLEAKDGDGGIVYRDIYDIDAKAGWNKMYGSYSIAGLVETLKFSTKNILTKEKEMKWTLEVEED